MQRRDRQQIWQACFTNAVFWKKAAAMDEKRKKFPVSLWNEKNRTREQTIEQVWFPGVHCDVGGYYKPDLRND